MTFIQNDFKTIQCAIYFTDIDKADTRVYRFLLPKLLTSHTNQLINKKMMSEKLEDLYGAYFKVRVENVGNLSIISMVLTIVDPKIVEDQHLLDEALSLFHQVLYDHTFFNEDIFNEEKRMLIEQWETIKDKKRLYAQTRFLEHFFENDLSGYPSSGKLKDIKKITLNKLYDYYQDVFLKNKMQIIVNGRVDQKDRKKIEDTFKNDATIGIPLQIKRRKPNPLRLIEEETHMNQAIIKIGYHFPVFRKDALYHAAVLLDIILGGYPESRLFKEVREKSGLCYDISSNYDYYKGVLMISSGVDLQQKDRALEIIKDQVQLMIDQGITQVELMQAQSYYIHQIKSSLDSQSYLTKNAFIRELLVENGTIEEKIEHIQKVEISDIESLLKELTLDTVYILHGGVK